MIIQACYDARAGDPEAGAWLLTEGLLWADAIDYELTEATVKRWLISRRKIPAIGKPRKYSPRPRRTQANRDQGNNARRIADRTPQDPELIPA